jgi:uncharacterized lipoprotein YmbA
VISLRRVAALAMVTVLASCGSSPAKRFYVLKPVPAERQSSARPDLAVQVAAVNIPATLDRQEMVRESAADSLQISDVNRWGAPLADMAQDVLTRDLMARLPAGVVIPPRTAAPSAAYEITVDLLQFGGDAAGNVVLEGGWSLFRLGSDAPLLSRNVKLSERPEAADYATQVQVMSRLLGRLADQIVSSFPSIGLDARP